MMYRIEQNFGEFGESPQFAKFFPNEARGHAVCVVNVRQVKQGT